MATLCNNIPKQNSRRDATRAKFRPQNFINLNNFALHHASRGCERGEGAQRSDENKLQLFAF